MSSLPEGWAAVAFGEIGDWRGGGTPSKSVPEYWLGEIPWVSPKDMKRSVIDDAEDRITDEAISASASNLIPSGSVLLVTRSGILRHSLPVARTTRDVAINQDLKALTPHEAVSPEFVTWYLRAEAQAILRECAKSGTTVDSIDFDRLKSWAFVVAPVAEQRRIVAKLDALTARTARARADLDRIPALAARYKQAVLAKAFSGELTAEVDAAEFSLVSLSGVLESTFYGPRFNKEAYCDAGVPTLRTTDFDDFGRVMPKGPPHVSVSAKELEKWGLRDGDLLVTRTGSIGKCAVYEASMGPALPSAYLIRTRLNLSRIVPRFALLFLLSPSGQEQLGLGITAVTQPNINAGVIERLQLPIPSLEAQAEVIAKVDLMLAEIDRLTAEAAAARRLLGRLDQAVLAKAFRGELVPQDPVDEPASVLLEHIRAERAAAPRAKRGRPGRLGNNEVEAA